MHEISRVSIPRVVNLIKDREQTQSLFEPLLQSQESEVQDKDSPSEKLENGRQLDSPSPNAIPSSQQETRGEKRKRNEIEIIIHDVVKLYTASCKLVGQLQALAADEYTYGYATHHLQASLRSSPDEAAAILGNVVFLMNHVLQCPKRRHHDGSAAADEAHEHMTDSAIQSCLSPLVQFWKSNSQDSPDMAAESVNVNLACPTDEIWLRVADLEQHPFVVHAMLPCLHLLVTFKDRESAGTGLKSLQADLEELLIKHVITPFRTANLGQADSLDAFTKAFSYFPFHRPRLNHRAWVKSQTHIQLWCLSLLFQIAISNFSWGTSKLQKTENIWLEKLFVQIRACASTLQCADSMPPTQKDLARLSRWMLRTAAEHELSLSIPSLKDVLEQTSCLFDNKKDSHVEWSVVSLCLKNNASVFSTPSLTHKKGKSGSSTKSSASLDALLQKITKTSCKEKSTKDEDYQFKISHVIIPLLHVFAEARDLSCFIAHWRDQLDHIQLKRREMGKPIHMTIWEDDVISQAASGLCESKMTVGQMSSVLNDAGHAIQDPQESNNNTLSAIVLIECIFNAYHSEKYKTGLAVSAGTIAQEIARILSHTDSLLGNWQWRAWRAIATFNVRWLLEPDAQFSDEVISLIDTAQGLLDRCTSRPVDDVKFHNADVLHVFTFLLSFSRSQEVQIPQTSCREMILKAFHQVLKLKEGYCDQLSKDLFGLMKPRGISPTWDRSSQGIKSIDELYLGCVSQLLLSKGAIE